MLCVANFVQILQYNSKSLILFVCGDGIAVCVEQNYIVYILGNIHDVLTQILYRTSLKQRHFYRTAMRYLSDGVLTFDGFLHLIVI